MHIPPPHLPLLLMWITLTLWIEVALFRLSAAPCSAPRAPPSASEARSFYALIADPQLTDAGSYQRGPAAAWPLRLAVDWASDSFMRRAYAHAVQSLTPDGELFLGDMFDTAAFGSDELFLRSLERFRAVFPPAPLRLFVPGNHDLGLMSAYSSQRRLRYTRYFGASDFEFESHRVPLRFVGINAPAVASGCPPAPPGLFAISAAERASNPFLHSDSCHSATNRRLPPTLTARAGCRGPEDSPMRTRTRSCPFPCERPYCHYFHLPTLLTTPCTPPHCCCPEFRARS